MVNSASKIRATTIGMIKARKSLNMIQSCGMMINDGSFHVIGV
jgi:hypothetical protein